MSRFSGKCDFFDTIQISGIDHIMNCDIWVGDYKLKQTSSIELVSFYGHIVESMGLDNENKTGCIHLSPFPFYEQTIMNVRKLYENDKVKIAERVCELRDLYAKAIKEEVKEYSDKEYFEIHCNVGDEEHIIFCPTHDIALNLSYNINSIFRVGNDKCSNIEIERVACK